MRVLIYLFFLFFLVSCISAKHPTIQLRKSVIFVNRDTSCEIPKIVPLGITIDYMLDHFEVKRGQVSGQLKKLNAADWPELEESYKIYWVDTLNCKIKKIGETNKGLFSIDLKKDTPWVFTITRHNLGEDWNGFGELYIFTKGRAKKVK